MATNYSRGRAFEYAVKEHFEKRGWWVVRSAGSKGVADLVALRRVEEVSDALLIQCKRGYKPPGDEFRALARAAKQVGGVPVVAIKKQRRGFDLYTVGKKLTMRSFDAD